MSYYALSMLYIFISFFFCAMRRCRLRHVFASLRDDILFRCLRFDDISLRHNATAYQHTNNASSYEEMPAASSESRRGRYAARFLRVYAMLLLSSAMPLTMPRRGAMFAAAYL